MWIVKIRTVGAEGRVGVLKIVRGTPAPARNRVIARHPPFTWLLNATNGRAKPAIYGWIGGPYQTDAAMTR